MKVVCAALLLTIMFFILDSFVVLDDETISILEAIERVFRNICIIVVCVSVFIGLMIAF